VTVPCQPRDIRRQHRIRHAHPPETPPGQPARVLRDVERLRVFILDPVIGTHVDDNAGAIGHPGEQVRRVTPGPASIITPVQPERLRHEHGDLRVEIQQHHMITLKPGLVPDMRPGGRRPPQAGQVLLASGPPELPDRHERLRPQPRPCSRPLAALITVRVEKGYLAVALVLHSGAQGGLLLPAALIVTGASLALGFSPLVTQSLVRVPPRHAADASGLLTTMIQLGQALGVAAFGSLFLTLDAEHGAAGPAVSGHALAITSGWLAATMVLGAAAGIPLARTVAAARRPAAAGSRRTPGAAVPLMGSADHGPDRLVGSTAPRSGGCDIGPASWEPLAAGDAVGAGPGPGRVARPVTPEDLSILALENETVAGHTCIVMVLRGTLGLDPLRSSIAGRLHRAPELGLRLGEIGGEPWWVPDLQLNLSAHVVQPDQAGARDEAGFTATVARIFEQRLDRSRPLWRIDVIPQLAGGRSALIWRIHHALADGWTAMRMASAVLWDAEEDDEPGAAGPDRRQRAPGPGNPVTHHRLGWLRAAVREAPRPWLRSPFNGHIGAADRGPCHCGA
jgi:wax ester synthase-like acyl-CoA acyltransferase family protein